jgi:hypothetical protein
MQTEHEAESQCARNVISITYKPRDPELLDANYDGDAASYFGHITNPWVLHSFRNRKVGAALSIRQELRLEDVGTVAWLLPKGTSNSSA